MRIVLDASILYRNWLLDTPDFRVLEKHMALGRSELFVPEIALLETISNYRKEVRRHLASLGKLRRLVPSMSGSEAVPDLEEICDAYRETLHARLESLGAQIPSHGHVPHDVLVTRALEVRKPFRESDKGYRDCLLWEVILRSAARRGVKTIFVSDNYHDFGAEPDGHGLHGHLRADLARADLPEDCVELYRSLHDLIREVIAADLETAVDEIATSLRDGSYAGFSLLTWFTEHRSDLTSSPGDWIGGAFDFLVELESPEVVNIEAPEREDICVEDVLRIDDERVVLYAVADADLTVDAFVFKADYYGLEDRCPLQIMDRDWNDHYMWVQIEVKLPLHFSLTLNVITNEVEQHEVHSAGGIFGWCPHCCQPILNDAAETCRHCGAAFF